MAKPKLDVKALVETQGLDLVEALAVAVNVARTRWTAEDTETYGEQLRELIRTLSFMRRQTL